MTVCTGTHAEPIHFNRGRHGHVWICVACGKQLAGPRLPDEERGALVEFIKVSRATLAERAKAKKEKSMKLELGIMAGAESKAWLADLTKVVERMEKAAGILGGKASASVEEEAPETEESDDDDFAPAVKSAAKKTAKAVKAASFDEEGDAPEAPAETEEAEDDDDFTAPPAKAAKAAPKAKKWTLDDCNDACKAKASSIGGKSGRAKVLEILKKNFKTESVSELKPEQYAKCVELMAV